MKSFNVLIFNFSRQKLEHYDIMPYLMEVWDRCKARKNWWPTDSHGEPKTVEEMKEFVSHACQYQFWSRCEYEFLILSWPYGKTDTYEDCMKVIDSATKIDIWEQIEMNLDIVTKVFMENLKTL